MNSFTNWAGNITFTPRRFHQPSSVDELRGLVAAAAHIRTLGSGHSFNRIADCPDDLVSVAGLPKAISLDAERATVTVAGGVRFGELTAALAGSGFALPNLGSLPHISIAGACSTGTHGSGDGNGVLATAVSALELVTAEGDLAVIQRGDPDFPGTVVALGALGVVTALTLDLVPAFEVAQYVYEDLPIGQDAGWLDEVLAAAYSVSMFTDWQAPRMNQVWLKHRVGDVLAVGAETWRGGTAATGPRNPVPGMSAENSTEQLGVPGQWHERLPHFRPDFRPSSGEELQSEYFVPRAHGVAAVNAMSELGELFAPVLQIAEIRTIAADGLWLSPCQGRESLALHFTWVRDTEAVLPVLAAIEARLAPFRARPHWGKVFGTTPETVAGLYEQLPAFQELLRRYDPAGKFRNEMLDRYVVAN